MEGAPTRLVAWQRPGPVLAVVLVLLTVAAATGVVYPLKQAAPVVSLGVVYLLGVLLVSTYVGLLAGLLTGLLSATAFNFFHLPPLHRFTLANSEDWVALAAFVVAAAIASRVADVARARAGEAEQQRGEADLAADLGRVLLGAEDRAASLEQAARLVAGAVGGDSAVIEIPPRPWPPGRGAIALPLADGDRPVGRLVVRGRLEREPRRAWRGGSPGRSRRSWWSRCSATRSRQGG